MHRLYKLPCNFSNASTKDTANDTHVYSTKNHEQCCRVLELHINCNLLFKQKYNELFKGYAYCQLYRKTSRIFRKTCHPFRQFSCFCAIGRFVYGGWSFEGLLGRNDIFSMHPQTLQLLSYYLSGRRFLKSLKLNKLVMQAVWCWHLLAHWYSRI